MQSPSRRPQGQQPRAASFDLNPEVAKRNRQARDRHHNTSQIPAARIIGLAVLAVLVAYSDQHLGDSWSPVRTANITASLLAYALGAWFVLRHGYGRTGRLHLGDLFLVLDQVVFGIVAYLTGGPESLFLFLPYLRVADLLAHGPRRVMIYAHLALGVVLAVLLTSMRAGVEVDLVGELVKVGIVHLIAMYVAATATTAQRLRERSRHAVHLARESIQQLQERTEQLARSKDEAEEASRTKSLFLANMSHEIRTPMNGVLGMCEVALGTDLTQEQEEYVGTIQSSAQALRVLVDDILDFSKIEAGAMTVERVEFNLHKLVTDTLRTLVTRAQEKGLEVVVELDPRVSQELVTDPVRLRQVLTNLVGNAIKFTARGHVAVTLTALNPEGPEPRLRIAVSDTGVGIPEDKLASIFEAFTQADLSTTRRFGGTGLGLAISQQLVELMGGQLQVESTLGQGSSFFFELPVEPHGPACSPSDGAAPRRALVALRYGAQREALALFLEGHGYQVAQAGTLAQAKGRAGPFDAVVWDEDLGQVGLLELLDSGALGKAPALLWQGRTIVHPKADRLPAGTRTLAQPVMGSEVLSALQQLQGQAPSSAPQEPEATTSRQVLVVEDNKVNQLVARKLLERWGHEVTLAAHGQEALDLCAEHSFDLILMDLQMPVLDGFEATAALQERASLQPVPPIYAMSANVLEEDRLRCEELGMVGFLSKPVDTTQLFGVFQALDGQDQASQAA